MKGKGLVAAIVIILAVAVIIFVVRPAIFKNAGKKAVSQAKVEKGKQVAPAAKKTFSKGMGGLTVKMQDFNKKPRYLRIKAFSANGGNSSMLVSSFGSDRMQELLPGSYDIEIDTVPPVLYKNINISEGKESVQDFGAITGSFNVKALNSKKKEAPLAIKLMHPKSGFPAASLTANRPAEVMSGVYDVVIETVPPQTKNGVRIENGKETVIDLGTVYGSLIVKALDENGKETRVGIRVKNPAANLAVSSTVTNRALEIAPGEYDIDIMSTPAQTKKLVKVSAGEETAVEVTVQSQKTAQPPAAAKRK